MNDSDKNIPENIDYEKLAEALFSKMRPYFEEIIKQGLIISANNNLTEKQAIEKGKGIVSDLPNVSETGRFSIKEASELLHISLSTINNYCNEGKLKYGIRKANGRKFITGAEIKRFWTAKY